jgi:hypothetical protein
METIKARQMKEGENQNILIFLKAILADGGLK